MKTTTTPFRINKRLNALLIIFLTLFSSITALSQCDPNNVQVFTFDGRCPANGRIVAILQGGSPCVDHFAVLTTPAGVEITLNVFDNGVVAFNDLAPGDYNLRFINNGSTVQYQNNPITVTSTYVDMDISFSSTEPSCPNGNDGTLTANINSGGIGLFIYEVVSSSGTQTFGPTAARSHTFNTMPGGEQVTLNITDTACNVIQTETPVIENKSTRPSDIRFINFFRDCTTDCVSYRPIFESRVYSAQALAEVTTPGNATISIDGGTPINLTIASIGAPPVISDTSPAIISFTPPLGLLSGGDNYTVSFNDGCDIVTRSSTVLPVDDDRLDITVNAIPDPTNCAATYSVSGNAVIFGPGGFSGTYHMFCNPYTVDIEQETFQGSGVFTPISSTPRTVSTFTLPLPGPGSYRLIASDACHSVVREFNTPPVDNPLNDISLSNTFSVLQGTAAIRIAYNRVAQSTNLRYTIVANPPVSSITINPTHPFTLAGSYTVNFPVVINNVNQSRLNVGDLPPGNYTLIAEDNCNRREIPFTTGRTTEYNPVITPTGGCISSGSIAYNMNTTNVSTLAANVQLYEDNGFGGLGALVQDDIPPNTFSGTFNNLSQGDYILRFSGARFSATNLNQNFSVVTLNGDDREYFVPVSVNETEIVTGVTTGGFCDANNPSSGFVFSEVTSSSPTYPLTFELFQMANPSTPVDTFTINDASGGLTHLFENVVQGDYFVRISTACGSVDLNTELTPPVFNPVITATPDTICFPGENIQLSINLPNSLFDITWEDDQGTNLGSGNAVTVFISSTTTYTANYAIRSTFCPGAQVNSASLTVNVTDIEGLESTSNHMDVSCNGGNDGAFTIIASNGAAPYNFSLDNITFSNTTGTFSGLTAGSYTVYIRDVNGCEDPTPITVTITEPDVISLINPPIISPILCNGDTTTVEFAATGGTAPYSYTFNGETNNTGVFNGVSAGAGLAYSITDANTCTPVTGTLNIIQPDAITLTGPPVVDPISCHGDTTTVTFTATGGTAPYSYTFNSETNNTGVFNNVPAGTALPYSVTDTNGCTPATGTVDINQPEIISLTGTPVVDPILCNGDTTTVTFTATGGTAPYAYTFNGETNDTGIFTGVAAGTNLPYSITDANTCAAVTSTLDITQPDVISLTGAPVVDPILCNGDTTTVTFTATGGTAPYAYTFNGQTNDTGIFTGVAAGTNLPYSITDANNCAAVTGTLDITEPDVISLTGAPVVDPILCNGDTTTVTFEATGGTAPYAYTFNGQTNDTGIFTGVAAGTNLPYSITDANNCAAVTGTLDITEPDVISLTGAPVVDPILCNGDTTTVTFEATGGTAPYSYTFNGQTNDTGIFTGVAAGTNLPYSITDVNNCAAVTGTLDITEPDVISLTGAPVVDPILCNGDTTTVTFEATGGTAPYAYTFNGQTNDTGIFTGVAAGTNLPYSVTDANNCAAVTGTLDINQPDVISLTGAPVVDPILCNGDTTTVTFEATGGTAPYAYTFNGQTNDTGIFTGVAAGTNLAYNITDANTCAAVTSTLDITQPDVISLTGAPVVDPILCNGDTTTVTFTATGGTAPYAYTFNGQTNDTGIFTGVAAGTNLPYSITDANNCAAVTGTLDITEPDVISLTGAPVVDPILCNGDTTTVTFEATGGTAPYSYTFNGQTNDTGIFTGVAAGTNLPYSVTDANNCAAVTGTLDINQPDVISLTGAPVVDPILCNGDTTTVTFEATGGTAPYAYTFNGQTNDTGIFTGVAAGTNLAYNITDANTCAAVTGTLDITQPDVISLTGAPVVDPILCNGDTTTVTFEATGGTAPYSYTFNGQTNDTGIFTGVAAGTGLPYSITDANNCAAVIGTLDITEPDVISLTGAPVVDPILCNGDTTTVTFEATGGTAPYSYTFNGQTNDTGIFTGVAAGTGLPYSITDANNCAAVTGTLDITEPDVISLTGAPVVDPILCNGDTTTVTFEATGGTAPYSYTFNGQTNDTGIFTGVAAGTNLPYSITDANNCAAVIGTLDITEPDVISLTGAPVVDPILCNGDTTTVTFEATGGTAPYSYTFNGQTNDTGIFTGVAAGTGLPYSITDANNCAAVTGTLDITEPDVISLTGAPVVDPILCNGDTTTVTFEATGGTAPYSYTFNGQTNDTGIFTGVAAGTNLAYSVTDANNCAAVTGTLDITEPDVISLTGAPIVDPILCNGDTTTVTFEVTGGTAPYAYTFNGQTNDTGIFTGVAAGTNLPYSITDANNCAAVIGTLDITEPDVISLTGAPVVDPILCNGDTTTVTFEATGGTAPYSYTFNGQTNDTGIFTGVAAGTGLPYSITDANTCAPVTGTLDINQPDIISLTGAPVVDPILCNGDTTTVTFEATGGTAPYSYTFNGQTNDTGIFTGVAAGTNLPYSITDANNCAAVTGTLDITEPDVISLTGAPVVDPILCNGDTTTVTFEATGGTAPYSYTFNGQTNDTGIFTGVAAGTNLAYNITDANNCAAVTGTLDITEPDVISLTSAPVVDPILCNGDTTTVTFTATGGTAPYAYTFNGQTNDTGIFTGVAAGTNLPYSITDANTCAPVTGTLDINQPDIISLTGAPVVDPILCNGDTTTVTFEATGGTAPYSYTFNGQTNDTGIFTGVAAGTGLPYSITDANNCAAVTGTLDITEPDVISLTGAPVVDPILCNGDTTTVTFEATGGTAPYAYTFNGQTNDTGIFTGVAAETNLPYSITDANNCAPVTGTLDINQPDVISLTGSPVVDPILCNGDTTTVTFEATGGTAPYSYTFNGQTNDTGIFTGVAAGTGLPYSITDANNCAAVTGTLDITEPDVISLTGAPVVDPILCNGDTTTVTFTATGGTAPYAYTFNGQTNDTGIFTGVAAGTNLPYSITDANTCAPVTGTLDINQPDIISLTGAPVVDPILCNGDTTTVTFEATGGTAPYAYTFNGQTNDTGIFTGVAAGTNLPYSITDANTCAPVTGTLDINQPDIISLTGAPVVDPILCNGDTTTVTFEATGGTAPYAYTFNGQTNDTGVFTGVAAGTNLAYSITDANNCAAVTSTLDITQPEVLGFTFNSLTNIDCNTDTLGSIMVTANGGTMPYTYSLNDGTTITTQNNGTFSGLEAGIYSVDITDANDCFIATELLEIEIIESEIIIINDQTCFDDGLIDLNDYLINPIDGGLWEFTSGPDNVTLNDDEFDPSNITLGDYVFTYTITTAAGCTNITEVTLNINDDCIVLPCSIDDVIISKAVTPNGDQYNQFFTITGVETCGFVFDVQIFNRWGSLVFKSDNYQNNWSGESSKHSVGSANTLPSGTYYYIVTLKNSGLNPITGPIYLGTK